MFLFYDEGLKIKITSQDRVTTHRVILKENDLKLCLQTSVEKCKHPTDFSTTTTTTALQKKFTLKAHIY